MSTPHKTAELPKDARRLLRFEKPKTAYSLLRQIQKEILAEPRRVNMDHWLIVGSEQLEQQLRRYEQGNLLPVQEFPSCQTVGCIAGWGATIAKPRSKQEPVVTMTKLLGFAEDLIGPDWWGDIELSGKSPLYSLFFPESWPKKLREKLKATQPGTLPYAKIVCKRIDRFIKKHESHLRRTKIK